MMDWGLVIALASFGYMIFITVWMNRRLNVEKMMDKALAKVKKEVSRDKMYDLVADLLLNLLEDEDLKATIEKVLNEMVKGATKGAVSGAVPKMKLEDMIGLAFYALMQKYMPQAAGAPAQAQSPINPFGT